MAGALLSYGALTGSARHREAALAALGVLGPIAPQYPRAAGTGLAVAEAVVAGPAEIAVVGPPGDPRTAALHTTALLAAPPGAVIALGDVAAAGEAHAGPGAAADVVADPGDGATADAIGDTGDGAADGPPPVAGDGAGAGREAVEAVPLLAGRGLVAGAPAAYVCRDFTCRMPVTDPMELRAALDYPAPAPAG